MPLTQIALQYTLMHPAVASNVVGVSSLEQLIENINSNTQQLAESEYLEIKKLTSLSNYTKHL